MSENTTLVFRPESSTYKRALAAMLAITIPVLVLLYVLTIPNGPWFAVLITQVFASLVWTWLSFAFFRVEVTLDDRNLTERLFLSGRRTIPRERIHVVLRLNGDDADAVASHLFLCDENGNRLLRLRGYYWSPATMDALQKALDVNVEIIDETFSVGDLREGRPELPYWYEGRPVLSAVLFALGAGVLGVVLYLVLHALEMVPA